MYSVSDEYLEQVHSAVQTWRVTGTVGSAEITDANILKGSLSITNKCSSSDVALGSVCIGEMKVTFLHNTSIDRFTWNGKEISLKIGLLVNGEYEDVPLQPYTVSSSKYTATGVVITAYDYMEKFDRGFGLSQLSGTPYELLTVACDYCGVALGMTQEEVEALPNGSTTIGFTDNTDMETYRDMISWLAVTLGGFATINRDGALVVKAWQTDAVDTYTSDSRITGAEYENYITEYGGVYLTYGTKAEYYGGEAGSVISLGSDPFIQMDKEETRANLAGEIVNSIANIKYMPCKFSVACGVHLDLGDVISVTGGLVDEATNICVMEYTFSYNSEYTIQSYGEDPTAAAKSKTDKEISGLISSTEENAWYIKTFTNAKDISVSDGKTTKIVNMTIGATATTTMIYLCEILAQVILTDGVESATITVTYYVNGDEVTTYHPKQIYVTDGDHMIHLLYHVPAIGGQTNTLLVYITTDGCSVTIPAQSITSSLSGSGIAGEVSWDGTIEVFDEFTGVTIDNVITVNEFSDGVSLTFPDVNNSTASDVFTGITIDNAITVGTFTDTVVGDMPVTNYTFSYEYESKYTYDTAIVTVENDMFELVDTFALSGVAEEVDEGLMSVKTIDKSNYTSVGGIEVE